MSSSITATPVNSNTRLVWNVPISTITNSFNLSGRFTIVVQVLDVSADCGNANGDYTNDAQGRVSDSCSGCSPLGPANSSASVSVQQTGGSTPAAAEPKISVSDVRHLKP